MTLSEFEALVYEYAELSYKVGRVETDNNVSQKAFDKLTDKRDECRSTLIQMFKDKHVNICG